MAVKCSVLNGASYKRPPRFREHQARLYFQRLGPTVLSRRYKDYANG